MKQWIFDVDGTLTPSRGKMDREFKTWFINFAKENKVSLVTGSDRVKTLEQVGEELYNVCQHVYQCAGNDIWKGNDNLFSSDWKLPKEVAGWLELKSRFSNCPEKTGRHIEQRPGLVNFSTVGRNATIMQRYQYSEWDKVHGERKEIVRNFNYFLKDLFVASVAGETGIDIYQTGKDKAQIVKYFNKDDELIFFGDKMDPNGNDYTLAMAIGIMNSHEVAGWQNTFNLLKGLTK